MGTRFKGVTRAGTIALVCCVVPVGLSACGSGASGSGTVAEQASAAVDATRTQATEAASATKPSTNAETPTKTVTAPAQTTTVTAPAQSTTVEKTVTASAPASTTSVTVQAAPSTAATSQPDEGGLEWWAWVLIGLAAAGAVVAAFAAGRHRQAPVDDPALEPTTTPEPASPTDTPPV
jgi:cobalamin biosynthesis Mg chelatase CobN